MISRAVLTTQRPLVQLGLVTHRRFPSQTHAAGSSETAAVLKVAARLRRCSQPLPEKEEVAVSNIQSRLVHIWVKTFRTCPHLGKNVPNLSTFGPSHLLKPVNGRNLTSHINLNDVLCTKKRIMTKCGQVRNVFTHLSHYPLSKTNQF